MKQNGFKSIHFKLNDFKLFYFKLNDLKLFHFKLFYFKSNDYICGVKLMIYAMESPFVYGKMAESEFFIDREKETTQLLDNFKSLVNTTIISPRRWGKTSLVNKTLEMLAKDKGFYAARIDIFNCRTEEQFYKTYVNAVLQASASKLDEWVALMKKHIGSVGPKISLGEGSSSYEVTFGLNFKEVQYSEDEILDLPQRIAEEKGKKFVICIDEFQNVGNYADSLAFPYTEASGTCCSTFSATTKCPSTNSATSCFSTKSPRRTGYLI